MPELLVAPHSSLRSLLSTKPPFCSGLQYTQLRALTFPDFPIARRNVAQFRPMRHKQKSKRGFYFPDAGFSLLVSLPLPPAFFQEQDHSFWKHSNHPAIMRIKVTSYKKQSKRTEEAIVFGDIREHLYHLYWLWTPTPTPELLLRGESHFLNVIYCN